MAYDKEYRVVACYPPDSGLVGNYDSYAIFRTPAHLDDGEIYRVELIVLDKVERARREEEEKLKREEYERLKKEEAITIRVEYPSDVNDGFCSASYAPRNERHVGTGDDCTTRGTITIPGPNPLNGELFVSMYPGRRVWCYINDLDKRMVQLPQDADLVYAEDDPVLAYFDVADREVAVSCGFKVVSFLYSRESRFAFYAASLEKSVIEQAPDGSSNGLPRSLVPAGTWYVFSSRSGEIVYLGTVEITGEAGKVYKLKFPPSSLTGLLEDQRGQEN